MNEAAEEGVTVNWVLYDFRHSFATAAAQGGVDLATLAALLGHGSLRTVQKYVHPTAEHKNAAMVIYEEIQKKRERPGTIDLLLRQLFKSAASTTPTFDWQYHHERDALFAPVRKEDQAAPPNGSKVGIAPGLHLEFRILIARKSVHERRCKISSSGPCQLALQAFWNKLARSGAGSLILVAV